MERKNTKSLAKKSRQRRINMSDIKKYHKEIPPIFPMWEKLEILVNNQVERGEE